MQNPGRKPTTDPTAEEKNPRRRLRHIFSHQAAPQPPRTRHYSSPEENKRDHKVTSLNPPNPSQIVSSPHKAVGYKQEADSKVETSLLTLEPDIAERLAESQQDSSESSRGSIAEIPAEGSDTKKEEEVGRQQQRIHSSSRRKQRPNHLLSSCKLHRDRPTQQGGGNIPKPRYRSTKNKARGDYQHRNSRHHRNITSTRGICLYRPLRPHRKTSNTEGSSQHRAPSRSRGRSRYQQRRQRRTRTSSSEASGLHRRTRSGEGSCLYQQTSSSGLHQRTATDYTNREQAATEIEQRENQPKDSSRREVTSEAPWRVQTNGPHRLKDREGNEILQTSSQIQFLQNMYCTLHATVQQRVDRCMDTTFNESLGTPAVSHKLQQHCMCVLEFRTHPKCCMVGRTYVAKSQKIIANKVLCMVCMNLPRAHIDSHACQEFLKRVVNTFEHLMDTIFCTSGMNLMRKYLANHTCEELIKHVTNTLEQSEVIILLTHGKNNLLRTHMNRLVCQEFLKYRVNTSEYSEYIIFITPSRMMLASTHIDYLEYSIFLKHVASIYCKYHNSKLYEKNFFPTIHIQEGPQLNLWNGFEVGVIRR